MTTKQKRFFIQYFDIERDEVVETLFATLKQAIEYGKAHHKQWWHSFYVWGIRASKLYIAEALHQEYVGAGIYSEWMNSEQHREYELEKDLQWHVEHDALDSWNEHVIKNNLGEKWLRLPGQGGVTKWEGKLADDVS